MSRATTVLRGGGTAVVLVQDDTGLPYVVHWGRDLPDEAMADVVRLATDRAVPHNALDSPWDLCVLPTAGEGWLGTPGFEAHRAGGRAAPRWVTEVTTDGAGVDTGGAVVIRAVDESAAVEVRTTYRL
ncbi:MAG: glycoside hydrolase family 36 N-terminal domain-containing protein, partial [Phycicoccus sp.]